MLQDTDPARPTTATCGLRAVLRVPGLPDLPLPLLLRYAAADPFAVRMVLLPGDGGDESVEWLFARSLLTDGLTAPTGEGDVRVTVEGREVCVELAGQAGVLLPLDSLVEFLAVSYEIVPTGAEPAALGLDLDAELAALLA